MASSLWLFTSTSALIATAGWLTLGFVMTLPLPSQDLSVHAPVITDDGSVSVPYPGRMFVADVATYADEVFAYLIFDQTRHTTRLSPAKLALKYTLSNGKPQYTLVARLSSDYVAAIAELAELRRERLIRDFEWSAIPAREAAALDEQTRFFVAAYNLPVRNGFDVLPKKQLHSGVQRFIRFKSTIDPRVRKGHLPLPSVLNDRQANRLAADILTLADFYSLPVDMFLGIGAIENNFMNVRGDLEHSVWKRRPAKDDIILERRRGRVRVLNDSAGVWQITRETLRYAHRLYLKDERDYSVLPEHLQPPEKLVMNELDPQVLSTYAGLLLRDLLDRFDGDVALAVGAYNGGAGNPNMKYEQWVRTASQHARKVVERATALNGRPAIAMHWMLAR